jgi:nucleotide-binding universal stress UspA family protein
LAEPSTRGSVVVGVDGSAFSLAALRWAAKYAEALAVGVRIVGAWTYSVPTIDPKVLPNMDIGVAMTAGKTRAQLESAVGPVAAAHPSVEFDIEVVEGPAAETVVKASEGADLLVVGSRGHHEVSELVLGSVSAYCVHHASCPVAVVR